MADEQMSVEDIFAALLTDAAGSEAKHIEAQARIAKMKSDLKAAALPEDQARIGLLAFRSEIQRRLRGERRRR